MSSCTNCQQSFEITDQDREFYDRISPVINKKKYSVPEPKLCPECRSQRRLAFYNRRKLYKRKCDSTGEMIISIYSPDKPFTVYEKEVWYSDKWDPLKYGRDFDFKRPFFEQFRELMESVPMLSLTLLGDNSNSDYSNDGMNLRNCYLTFDGTKCDDAYYGESYVNVESCCDFLFLEESQHCYECTDCKKCYGLKYSQQCNNCSDSWFLRDCDGCKNCFGCVNLRQQEYHIFNKPHSKEEYQKFMEDFDSGNYEAVQKMKQKAEEFFLTQPVRAIHGVQNENVLGDNLTHCRNAYYCFDSNYLEDCEYCSDSQTGAKDSYDIDVWGEGMELCYNCCVTGASVRHVMCGYYVSEGVSDVYYSMYCSRNVKDLFGCIGLRQKDHCILNKEYSEEDYEKEVGKIIEHMQETGEWGEFFPPEISAFAYNETVADDHYPLSKEEVLKKGWQWKDEPDKLPEVEKTIPAEKLPDDIADIPDDILNWAVVCEKTGKPFRITTQELHFYRTHKLPVPHIHPNERHHRRTELRNPHHLWDRECSKCKKTMQTTYAPDRPEKIYCEDCYRGEVY